MPGFIIQTVYLLTNPTHYDSFLEGIGEDGNPSPLRRNAECRIRRGRGLKLVAPSPNHLICIRDLSLTHHFQQGRRSEQFQIYGYFIYRKGLGPSDFFWMLYDKPWIRMTPYLVGILGGWFYWKKGDHLTRLVQSFPEVIMRDFY